MLEHPKFLLFVLFLLVTLTFIGGLMDGVLTNPAATNDHDSAFYMLQHGDYLTKLKAVGKLWFWDYPWLSGSLEYVAWVPFRLLNIVFTVLLAIACFRLARELLPIP